mmetsp:Transcript_88884/g.154160  ORF Transcript_88884/g.154160 Transcript_88884/m.154160 type:complete len:2920 (-) Transcript_88884:1053-9812(-)
MSSVRRPKSAIKENNYLPSHNEGTTSDERKHSVNKAPLGTLTMPVGEMGSQGLITMQRLWKRYLKNRQMAQARKQIRERWKHEGRGTPTGDELMAEMNKYQQFLETKSAVMNPKQFDVQMKTVVPHGNLSDVPKACKMAAQLSSKFWLIMAIILSLLKAGCTILLVGFWVTMISQVVLGTSVGNVYITKVIFFLLVALLVYNLVATANGMLWSYLEEQLVKLLDLRLLSKCVKHTKLISQKEIRTLRCGDFQVTADVVFEAIPNVCSYVLILLVSIIWSFATSVFSGLIYVAFLILMALISAQSNHLNMRHAATTSEVNQTMRAQWPMLGSVGEDYNEVILTIFSYVHHVCVARSRHNWASLLLQYAYQVVLMATPLAYLWVGMLVASNGELRGPALIRQLVVLICGLGSMKEIFPNMITIMISLQSLTRAVTMTKAFDHLYAIDPPTNFVQVNTHDSGAPRRAIFSAVTWCVVVGAVLAITLLFGSTSGEFVGCPDLKVRCMVQAGDSSMLELAVPQQFSTEDGCLSVDTESAILGRCVADLLKARSWKAETAVVSASWLDWANKQRFIKAHVTQTASTGGSQRRLLASGVTVGATEVGSSSCTSSSPCSQECSATCTSSQDPSGKACGALGTPSGCTFLFTTGAGIAGSSRVQVTVTENSRAQIHVVTPSTYISGTLNQELSPALSKINNIALVARALAVEVGLTGSWSLAIDDQMTNTSGLANFTSAGAYTASFRVTGQVGTTVKLSGTVDNGKATNTESGRCVVVKVATVCVEDTTATVYAGRVQVSGLSSGTGISGEVAQEIMDARTLLSGTAEDQGTSIAVSFTVSMEKFGEWDVIEWGADPVLDLTLPKAGGIKDVGVDVTATIAGVLAVEADLTVSLSGGWSLKGTVGIVTDSGSLSGTVDGSFQDGKFTMNSIAMTGIVGDYALSLSKQKSEPHWEFQLDLDDSEIAAGNITLSKTELTVAGQLTLTKFIDVPTDGMITTTPISFDASFSKVGSKKSFALEASISKADPWEIGMLEVAGTIGVQIPNPSSGKNKFYGSLTLSAPSDATGGWGVSGTIDVSYENRVWVRALSATIEVASIDTTLTLEGSLSSKQATVISADLTISNEKVLSGWVSIDKALKRYDFDLTLVLPPTDTIKELKGNVKGYMGKSGYHLTGSLELNVLDIVDVTAAMTISTQPDACPCTNSGLCFSGAGLLDAGAAQISGTIGACKLKGGKWQFYNIDLKGTLLDIVHVESSSLWTAEQIGLKLAVSFGSGEKMIFLSVTKPQDSTTTMIRCNIVWPDLGFVSLPNVDFALPYTGSTVLTKSLGSGIDLVVIKLTDPRLEIDAMKANLRLATNLASNIPLFNFEGEVGANLGKSGLSLDFNLTSWISGLPFKQRVWGSWSAGPSKELGITFFIGDAVLGSGYFKMTKTSLEVDGQLNIPKKGILPLIDLSLHGIKQGAILELESDIYFDLWGIVVFDGSLHVTPLKKSISAAISTRGLPLTMEGDLNAELSADGSITGDAEFKMNLLGATVIEGSASLTKTRFGFDGTFYGHRIPGAKLLFGTFQATVSGYMEGPKFEFSAGFNLDMRKGTLGLPVTIAADFKVSDLGLNVNLDTIDVDLVVLKLRGSGTARFLVGKPAYINAKLTIQMGIPLFKVSGTISMLLDNGNLDLKLSNCKLEVGPVSFVVNLAIAVHKDKFRFEASFGKLTVFGNELATSGNFLLVSSTQEKVLNAEVKNLKIKLGPAELGCDLLKVENRWTSDSGLVFKWQGDCTGKLGPITWGKLSFYADNSKFNFKLRLLGLEFKISGEHRPNYFKLEGQVSVSFSKSLTTSIKYPCGVHMCSKRVCVWRACATVRYPCGVKMCYLSLGKFYASIGIKIKLQKKWSTLSASATLYINLRYGSFKFNPSLTLAVNDIPTNMGALYNKVKNKIFNAIKNAVGKVFSLAHQNQVLHGSPKFTMQDMGDLESDSTQLDCCNQTFTDVPGDDLIYIRVPPSCQRQCTWKVWAPGDRSKVGGAKVATLTFDRLNLQPASSLRTRFFQDQSSSEFPTVYLLDSGDAVQRFPTFTTDWIEVLYLPAIPFAVWHLDQGKMGPTEPAIGAGVAPTADRDLFADKALMFPGSAGGQAVLTVPSSPGNDGGSRPYTAGVSIMAWLFLKQPPVATSSSPLCRGTTDGWCFKYTPTGHLEFSCYFDAGTATAQIPNAMPQNVWLRVTGTCASDIGVRLFMNGRLEALVEYHGNVTHNDLPITLGGAGFQGSVDEVSLFDFDLDIKQVRELGGFSSDEAEAQWMLDGDADDHFGKFNGTLHGPVTAVANRDGTAGRALQLGPGAYITLPPPSLSALTVMAWLRLDALPSDKTAVICKGWQAGSGWCLHLLASGKLQFQCFDELSGEQTAQTDAVQSTGQWLHVAASCDRVEVAIIVNGVRQADDSTMGSSVKQNNNSITIGTPDGWGLAAADAFRGQVDDLRIYDRTLNSMDVRRLTALQRGPGASSDWPMDGAASDRITGTAGALYQGPALVPDRNGIMGNAVFLDGYKGQYAELGTRSGLAAFTATVWARFASFGTEHQAIMCNAGLSTGWCLELDLDGKLQFSCHDGTVFKYASADEKVVLDRWTHVAGTCDSLQVTLYINGVQQGLSAQMQGPPVASTFPILLGARPRCAQGCVDRVYYGSVDDASLIPGVLDGTQLMVLAGLLEEVTDGEKVVYAESDLDFLIQWLTPFDEAQYCNCTASERCVADSDDETGAVFTVCKPKLTPQEQCAKMGCPDTCFNAAAEGQPAAYMCKEKESCDPEPEPTPTEDGCQAEETQQEIDVSGCANILNVSDTVNVTVTEDGRTLLSNVTEEDLAYIQCRNESLTEVPHPEPTSTPTPEPETPEQPKCPSNSATHKQREFVPLEMRDVMREAKRNTDNSRKVTWQRVPMRPTQTD